MLSEFSVKKPYTIFVAAILAILLGVISLMRSSTDLLPNISLPYVAVITTYPGATPEKVEASLTKPLEQALATTGGVKSIQSSSAEGASIVFVEFTQDTDLNGAIIEMNSAIDMIKGYFDDTVSSPMIMQLSPDMIPAAILAVDIEGSDQKNTTKYVDANIIPNLEKISGVASVTSLGAFEERVRITVDAERITAYADSLRVEINRQFDEAQKQVVDAMIALEALKASMGATGVYDNEEYERQAQELDASTVQIEAQRNAALAAIVLEDVITSDMISGVIAADNFSFPAGYIDGDKEGESYVLKIGDSFADVQEICDLELVTLPTGDVLKLSDVATIEVVDNSDELFTKVNGNDGVILIVQKQSTASTADVCHEIQSVVDSFNTADENLSVTAISDQGSYIDLIINAVGKNLIFGALLAIIVLIVFLRSLRPILLIAVSIPISLLTALAAMYFTGISLNLISLAGLALSVGMLVDNSIVVIENIFRLHDSGLSPRDAAIRGASEMSGAIIASTLTTICVFLPIVFTNGISRQLFADMGLTIAFTLIASLLAALTLVPAAAPGMLKSSRKNKAVSKNKLASAYKASLRFVLRFKVIVILPAIALLAFCAWRVFDTGIVFMPEADSPQLSVSIPASSELSVSEARQRAIDIAERISDIAEIDTLGLSQGQTASVMTLFGGASTDNSMTINILLKTERERSSAEIMQDIRDKTADMGCDLEILSTVMDISTLTGSGVAVNISGNDLDLLNAAKDEISELVASVDGIDKITSLAAATNETRVVVDKNKAMSYGLTIAQVYAAVSESLTTETTASTLTIGNSEYDIVIYDSAKIAPTHADISEYMLTLPDGTQLALSELATITDAVSADSISHIDQKRTVSVTASLKEGYNISLVSRNVEDKLSAYTAPAGCSVELSGEFDTIMDSVRDLLLMLAVGVVFIYLIMVAQFQSLLSPFIVMFTIPLAFTGGFLALLIFNAEISIIALLGFLVLAGVIVNNGIVYVDCANRLMSEGLSRRDASVEAGGLRIRPILMTAVTTIFGLATLSMGIDTGADMLRPLAMVAVGGLIYGTIMTLYVVPALYDILAKKRITAAKPAPMDTQPEETAE